MPRRMQRHNCNSSVFIIGEFFHYLCAACIVSRDIFSRKGAKGSLRIIPSNLWVYMCFPRKRSALRFSRYTRGPLP